MTIFALIFNFLCRNADNEFPLFQRSIETEGFEFRQSGNPTKFFPTASACFQKRLYNFSAASVFSSEKVEGGPGRGRVERENALLSLFSVLRLCLCALSHFQWFSIWLDASWVAHEKQELFLFELIIFLCVPAYDVNLREIPRQFFINEITPRVDQRGGEWASERERRRELSRVTSNIWCCYANWL